MEATVSPALAASASSPAAFGEFVPASKIQADQDAALAAQAAAIQAKLVAETPSLLSYMQRLRDEAVLAKQTSGVTDRLLDAQRRRLGEHTPEKLKQLKQYNLPVFWVPLTSTKCIHTEAWLRDLLMPYADKVWLLEPTVIPELPKDKTESILRSIAVESLELFANGQELTEDEVKQIHDDALDESERRVLEEAKDRVKAMERLIQDQHEQADFRGVFRELQSNLVTYGTAFIKGPFTVSKKLPKWLNSKRTVVDTVIPTASAPSPHDIFPAPWAKNEQDGWIFERIKTYPEGLEAVRTLPYYQRKNIDLILSEHAAQPTTLQYGDTERTTREDKPTTPTDDRIEIWEFRGPVAGKMLVGWGIEGIDETRNYRMEVQFCGTRLIKVMPCWDEVGTNGYFGARFKPVVGSFWGIGVPHMMAPSQDRANTTMISLIANMQFTAGMSGWVDINGLLNIDDVKKFDPFKLVAFERKPGQNGDPMGFFNIPSKVAELSAVYQGCLADADNESGVPAYMYGSGSAGAAGGTYSGLQTLMNASTRGIKDALLEIGVMLSKYVQHQADWNNEYSDREEVKGDVRVVCSAGVGLFVQELQLSNLDNLLNQAVSLAGAMGPRMFVFIMHMLREKAKILKIDVRALPSDEELMAQAQGMAQGALAQQTSAASPGAPAPQLLPANTQPGARPEAPAPLPPIEPSEAQPSG